MQVGSSKGCGSLKSIGNLLVKEMDGLMQDYSYRGVGGINQTIRWSKTGGLGISWKLETCHHASFANIVVTASGATSDDKVGIMTPLSFQ